MRVQLKLYGVFRSAASASSLTVEIPENERTVKSAIERIFAQGEFGTLRSLTHGQYDFGPSAQRPDHGLGKRD